MARARAGSLGMLMVLVLAAPSALAKGGGELLAATAHTLAGPARVTIPTDGSLWPLAVDGPRDPGHGIGACVSVVYEKGDAEKPLWLGLWDNSIVSPLASLSLTPGDSAVLCGADVAIVEFECPYQGSKDCTFTFRVDGW